MNFINIKTFTLTLSIILFLLMCNSFTQMHAQETKIGMNAMDYRFLNLKKEKTLPAPYQFFSVEAGGALIMKSNPEHQSPYYETGANFGASYTRWLTRISALKMGLRGVMGEIENSNKRDACSWVYAGLRLDYIYALSNKGIISDKWMIAALGGFEGGYSASDYAKKFVPGVGLGLKFMRKLSNKLSIGFEPRYSFYFSNLDGMKNSNKVNPQFSLNVSLLFRKMNRQTMTAQKD